MPESILKTGDARYSKSRSVPHCRVLPHGEFDSAIPMSLSIYCESFAFPVMCIDTVYILTPPLLSKDYVGLPLSTPAKKVGVHVPRVPRGGDAPGHNGIVKVK